MPEVQIGALSPGQLAKDIRDHFSLSFDPESLLTEQQAADFLQVRCRTLQAWRLRGGGSRICPYLIACHTLLPAGFISWAEARLAKNTADHTANDD